MKYSNSSKLDSDASKYNRRYAVLAMAKEILRNGSSLMLESEAVAEAEKRYDAGIRPEVRAF